MQRHIPFGYRIWNGKAEILPQDAQIVKAIFQAYLKRISTNQIAKGLTEQRVPNSAHKYSWNHVAIGKILQNKKYLGDDFYPRLISDEAFEKVQKMRRETAEYLGRGNKPDMDENSIVFKGKIYCGYCKEIYYRYREHRDQKERIRWKCRHSVKEKRLCSHKCFLTDEQLEDTFVKIINGIIVVPTLLEPGKGKKAKNVAPCTVSDKLTLEIQRALETGEYTAEEIKHLAFLRASAQYQASTIDDSAFQTEKLRKAILGQDIQNDFSKELFRQTIRKIVVYE